MTEHPPTLTAAELLDLFGRLEATCDALARTPDWCESTGAGYLLDADYESLLAAKRVIHRLHRWTKWPRLAAENGSYLDAPLTAAPEPENCRRCGHRVMS